MTYTDFNLWRAACLSHGLIPVQRQGFHRFEFRNHQGTVVAEWDGTRDWGEGPDPLPPPAVAA
jgi:hypothetical protein